MIPVKKVLKNWDLIISRTCFVERLSDNPQIRLQNGDSMNTGVDWRLQGQLMLIQNQKFK